MATPNQQFCLRWNNHQPNFIAVFSTLLRSESMCDVTLATEGKHILAHKIVLSACSSYFQMLFAINPCKHPIVILKDVQFKDLKTLIDFVYFGEVNVSQDHLPSLLKTAETLQIKGLTEMPDRQVTLNSIPSSASTPQPGVGGGGDIKTESPLGSPSGYKRKRMRKSSAESVATTIGGEDQETSTINTRDIQQQGGQLMHGTMVKHEPHHDPQRQPTPQMDDKSPRSASMSSAEAGPSSGNKSDLLLPVKTIILTSSQSKSLDSGIGGDSSAVSSAATSMESSSASTLSSCLGSKTRRFLMRQHRVKKEYEEDRGEGGEEGEGGTKVIARQCSEPAPHTEHLLSVPQASHLTKQHSHPLIISTSSTSSPISPSFHVTSPTESSASRPLKMEEFRRASSTPQYTLSLPSSCLSSFRDSPSGECRSSHCPELRQGPALGCNFCWNTIDGHGRILRRKTKYHCPECQTNLCIVPCFQQYHERQEPESSGGGGSRKPSHLQPTIVKTGSI